MFATSLKIATKYDYLAPKFKAAYEWLEKNDPNKLEDGKYEITEGVFALVQRYTTLPFAKARFEAHNDYFDIQFLTDGEESFGVALREGAKLVESNESGDCYFYETPKFFTAVNLKAGDFVVVPPEEIHQPRAAYNGIEKPVVKVVVKVKL